MPTLNVSDDQVIELITQLPPERKRAILYNLAKEAQFLREKRLEYGENQIRKICLERGLNWDLMSDGDREAFIDLLIHEDRQ
ncbi:MAG: hypothetical protein C0407_03890 [Desulfobacca sp.]|nr:hypothetical protein [Desulfobacca sp.]